MSATRRGFLRGLLSLPVVVALPAIPKLTQFQPLTFSIVRRVRPSLLVEQLVGVQPMTGPTGVIFALKPGYGRHDRA